MKKFAVIDIGSNSVCLLLVAGGKTLYKRLNTTRLGEGIAKSPRLLPSAIERTANAVASFYIQALADGAEEVFAFATAAVRSAENRQEFLDRVYELCRLKIEVLSGEEEAEIGLLGALGNADGGVIDIGGASTEIVLKKEGKILYKKSVNIGVVRIKDICGANTQAVKEKSVWASQEFDELPKGAEFHAIGGTATTLAARYLRLREYSSEKITGTSISAEEMQVLADDFSKMTTEEIAKLPCMPQGRADVITGGAILLATLMQNLGMDKIVVSDRDNLEGYAIKRGFMQ